jgi:dTDP-4-dehydrorhamnose reductase
LKLAIIGAEGQVGQEFGKVLPSDRLELFGHGDVDVADADSVEALFKRIDADVVVNLAAFHRTDDCEIEPARAFAVNALGALHVATAAARRGIKSCFFSTDYVFGGEEGRTAAYVETDTPAPINVYGVSKMAGEALVRAVGSQHLIVRSSSLFGAVTSRKGWTFPRMILERARKGERLRVVNDQVMAPTYTHDLVRHFLLALAAGAEGVIHITNGGACTWWEFASTTLELAGIGAEVEPVDSSTFPTKARRPRFSALGTARGRELGLDGPRHWKQALAAYLDEIGARGGR